jgi:hypothetical protein
MSHDHPTTALPLTKHDEGHARKTTRMQGVREMQIINEFLLRAWSGRRSDTGGLSDETAMIGLMLIAAVAVGGIIFGLVTGAANRIDFGF